MENFMVFNGRLLQTIEIKKKNKTQNDREDFFSSYLCGQLAC